MKPNRLLPLLALALGATVTRAPYDWPLSSAAWMTYPRMVEICGTTLDGRQVCEMAPEDYAERLKTKKTPNLYPQYQWVWPYSERNL